MRIAARATATVAVLCSMSLAAAAPVDKSLGERGIGADPDPLLFVLGGEGVLVAKEPADDVALFGDDFAKKYRAAEKNLGVRSAAYKAAATVKNAELLVAALTAFADLEYERRGGRTFLKLVEQAEDLCRRHKLSCKGRMYEREGNEYLQLRDGVAALAAYTREGGVAAPEEKYYSRWDKLISRFLAARLAGRNGDAIGFLSDAEAKAKESAAVRPLPTSMFALVATAELDGYTDVDWHRRHAWTLNWRGDLRLADGDKSAAAKDYDAALELLRAYEARYADFATIVDEAAYGPKELRPIYELRMTDPDAGKKAFKEKEGAFLEIDAAKRYAEKIRVARDIAWTLRRIARVDPSRASAIDTELAAITSDLLKRDPGPGISGLAMYQITVNGDARRCLGDVKGALEIYEQLHEMQLDLFEGKDVDFVDITYFQRAIGLLEGRIGFVLMETGKTSDARKSLLAARKRFEANYQDRPSHRSAMDIAWIDGILAEAN